MKNYQIASIPGDGIGPEVVREGIKVLNAVAALDGNFRFSWTEFPWGCEYYLSHGKMMEEDGIEKLKPYDAIYLGAVGAPCVPDHISLWGLLLAIRKNFDQYINLRPVKLLHGAPCPLKNVTPDDINMTFIRENSEGEYAGSGAWLYKDQRMRSSFRTAYFPAMVVSESSDTPMISPEKKIGPLQASVKATPSIIPWFSGIKSFRKSERNTQTWKQHLSW